MTITRICADILLSGIVRLVILLYLCSKLHIMMGKRTTALQYAFRASLPIMAGYRHGSCWRSSHYAYTFRPFRGIRLRSVHSLAWGDVAQVISRSVHHPRPCVEKKPDVVYSGRYGLLYGTHQSARLMILFTAFRILLFSIVQSCCLVKSFFHIENGKMRINDFYAWAVAHEDRIHFEIYADFNLKDTAAILLILILQLLRGMKRFGLDVFALFRICPKPDTSGNVVQFLAYSYNIVEEML